MQRIDRELNASLDISRALTITLEWAMRLSGVDAGLIGMMEEGGVRVMAASGSSLYDGSPPGGENGADETQTLLLPEDFPALKLSLQSGMPEYLPIDPSSGGSGPPGGRIMLDSVRQVAVPI